MNDATAVRRSERVSHLDRDREGTTQIEWPAVDDLAYVATFHVLHRDELNVIDFMQTEDRADVWMIERRGELGFTFKTDEVGSAVSEIGRENFYDCGPIERR